MTVHPVEVDWLSALEALAHAAEPRVVVAPASVVGDDEGRAEAALVAALVEEARAFHGVEADVARRRLGALEEEAARRAEDVGHATASDAAAKARAELAAHVRTLATVDEDRARAALRGWRVVSSSTMIAPEAATALVLHDDGWTRAALDARLAARREYLGLLGDRDWA